MEEIVRAEGILDQYQIPIFWKNVTPGNW